MKKSVFFHVRYSDLIHHPEALLDMMRYDGAEILQPLTDEVEWLTLANGSGPTTARWHSFGVAVRENNDPRYSISKRPKAEVYALVKRDHFVLDEDAKWFRQLVDVLAQDRAIVESNPPGGFYLFRFASHAPKFDKWRAIGCPIHAAYLPKRGGYPPSDIFTAAEQPPKPLDVVIPSLY